MLCLSCVVAFCTVYALILPADALEKKTVEAEISTTTDETNTTTDEISVTTDETSITTDETNTTTDEISITTDETNTTNDEVSMTTDATSAVATVPVAAASAATSGGLNLSDSANEHYVAGIELDYLKEDGNWQKLDPEVETTLPTNTRLKLVVNYMDVPIVTLQDIYNSTLTYDLPDQLRKMTAVSTIMAGSTKVGDVTIDSGKIIVKFTEDYLNKAQENRHNTIEGSFYTEGEIVLKNVGSDGKTTVTIAGKKYKLELPDAVAKYGEITVDKQCTSPKVIVGTDGSYYIEYQITVTAGEDGCPDVSVVDTFTSGSDRIASYEVLTSGATVSSGAGSMTWTLGNLAENESRILTYRVKLKDRDPLNTGEIKNQAQVYAQKYPRATDEASFTPKIKYKMPKSKIGDIVRKADGTYTITYKIEFQLDKNDSTYPLKDFTFWDYLNYSDFYTDSRIRQYVIYNRDSVTLYKKADGASDYIEVAPAEYVTSWSSDKSNYVSDWTDTTLNPECFKITGAEGKPIIVNPGDAYYATYTVTVKPEALAVMKKDRVEVTNRYLVSASNAKNQYFGALDRVHHTESVGKYSWNEKIGSEITSDQKITLPDGNTFTVPAGSYQYTVNVNRTLGDWDVTGVSMKDTLSSDKMQYVGYAKIEACKYNTSTEIYDVKETRWIPIDGQTSFSLKPSEHGWTNNNYAYRLTYYAKPVNKETFGTVTVNNKFELSGAATRGGKSFDITGLNAQTSVKISGDYNMTVTKSAWYYEEPVESATTWKNGKLYWVIEVDGTAILNGTSFCDYISKETGIKDSYLHPDSLAGIYQGTLPSGKTVVGYNNLKELMSSGGLTDVSSKFEAATLGNSKGFSGTDNYSELTVKTKEQITLGTAGKLYLIIMTEPQSLPVEYRDAFTYKNHIKTSEDGTSWSERGNATISLYGGGDILKELGQTFTYDGATVISNSDGMDKGNPRKIVKDGLKESGPGQYASWVFKLNYGGEMYGAYRVLENIPDGMELAYIRIKWTGTGQKTITSKEIAGLEAAGWTKKTITAGTDNVGVTKTTVYYVKGNQALIELGDFKEGRVRDNYSVDVQVVCKLTDPKVLLGGEEKEFVNTVVLQTTDGTDIKTATSSATMMPQKIVKTYAKANEKITFTITSNPLGQALPTVSGSKLKLIDKLSTTLRLDTTSIKVVNSNDSTPVTFKASLKEDNTLEIEVPHDVPVTITYVTVINAPPGQSVSFSNEAYWDGYSPTGGTKVEESNYAYSAGGTVTSGTSVRLKIVKNDQNDLSIKLSGAEFEVVECTRNSDGTITEVSTGSKWTGATDSDGTLTFGNGSSSDPLMKYNTIYKVTETKAPDGYIKKDSSYYIMVPKIESGETDYTAEVKACIADSRIQKQYESTYELIVSNHKGEITVEKKFKNAEGSDADPVSGTYWFGLYDKSDGTNTNGSTVPLQKVSITYMAGETVSKTAKFVDLSLMNMYYIFELDDEDKPIKTTEAASVNGMEYLTSYVTEHMGGTSNCAVNGEKVTITNQSQVKVLPSTGGVGVFVYRLTGILLILLAGMLMLKNRKK